MPKVNDIVGEVKDDAAAVAEDAKKVANQAASAVRQIIKAIKDATGLEITIKMGILLMACGLFAGGAMAQTTQMQTYDSDAVHGTFKVVDDGAGAATLTTDHIAINSNLTVGGSITATGALTGLATNSVVNTITVTGAGTVGTTLTVTGLVTAVAGIDATEDITLENDEKIRNDVDSNVEVIYNDDSATLGKLILDTSIGVANQADNDLYEIVGRGADTATNDTDYAKIQLQITDNTSGTENGQIILKTTANGSDVTGLTIGHNAGGTHACTIVPATAFTGGVDINANSTTTNITMDAGSQLSCGDGVVTNVGAMYIDSIAPDGTAVSINTGTGEVTVDGKYAVVGQNATTGLMIDASSVTIGAGGTVEVVWTVAFGAAPFPTATYAGGPGAATLSFSSVTTSNAILSGTASSNAYWNAIGTRP